MSRPPYRTPTGAKLLALMCLAVVAVGLLRFVAQPVQASQLGNRRLMMSSANAGASGVDYLLSFDLATPGPLGSITAQFCSNDPFSADPCTVPPGLDVSGVTLADQSGATGFTISPATSVNQLVLTRPPTNASVGPVSYHFTGAVNPSVPGTYYVRLQTFATPDASGPASDYGGIAIAVLNAPISINAMVPPYLIFCTGVTISGLNCANAVGDFIDFGELLTSRAATGSSQMLIGTNAQSGYNITVSGTTLSSGVNSINALATADVSRPGVSQFGFNLRGNTTPANGSNPFGPGIAQPQPLYDSPNIYRFVSGDVIVSNTVPDNLRQFTASYIVNRPVGQAPGIYVSTLTYIALATF